MTWGTDIDMEELLVQLEDTRIVRLALDSLEEHLPDELASDGLTAEFVSLRDRLAEMERKALRKIGHREYMILAPIDQFECFGGKAAEALRTLDDLGLVIRLDS
jgi:hypothetical protein